MKRIHLSILFLLFSVIEVQVQAVEQEAVVIEVRKNIQMTKNEKVFKNFFINGGENMGLKKGTIVDVLRRVPFHDPLKNISIGDIRVKVAELEIIHADGALSVAKQISQESPENRPLLEYEAIMVGDRLDLETARTPQPKKVALLSPSNEAQQLMKEGEQNLRALIAPQGRQLASIAVVGKKTISKKKSVAQKKK